jgi:RHS repeat-associated protein
MKIFKHTWLIVLAVLLQHNLFAQETPPVPYTFTNFTVTVTNNGSSQTAVFSDFNLPANTGTILLMYRAVGSGGSYTILGTTYGDGPEVKTIPLGSFEFALEVHFTNGSPFIILTPTGSWVDGKYVRTWEANAPEQSSTNLKTRPIQDVKQSTVYVDGFGRPIQAIKKKGSLETSTGLYADLVTPFVYDEMGREKAGYLPFVANNTGGNTSIDDGLLKLNPFQQQISFYNSHLSGQTGETNVGAFQRNWAYQKAEYEASPVNRVMKNMAPGAGWVGSNRGAENKYWVNTATDDIKIFRVNPPQNSQNFGASIMYSGGNQLVTCNFTNQPGASTSALGYRPQGSTGSYTFMGHGSPTSPRTFTLAIGNYDYALQFWFSGGLPSQIIEQYSVGTFGVVTMTGTYAAGTLFKSVNVDEHGMQTIEFKDTDDKVILKKVQIATGAGVADDGNGRGYTGWLCTYYIYDNMGRVRCVIQPEGVKVLAQSGWPTTSEALLNEQAFRYEYDKNSRVIIRKAPGKEQMWMVYDARGRLVMSQDARQRSDHKWMYSQYDELNRIVATGLITDNANYNILSYHTDAAATSTSYPNLGSYTSEELTRTFYDDYNWLSQNGNPFSPTRYTGDDGSFLAANPGAYPYAEPLVQGNLTKGLPTGTKTKVLGASQYLFGIIYYDKRGRVIQTINHNITNGSVVNTMQYNFSGQLLASYQTTGNNNLPSYATGVPTKFEYDNLGRLARIKKIVYTSFGVNTGEKTIVENEYDKLGRLKKKKLAPAYGLSGLETMVYEYNIRGWLLGANRDYVKDADNAHYFGYDLNYDKTDNSLFPGLSYGNQQYNGNVGGTTWKSKGDGEKRRYDYFYDAASRLLRADFKQYTGGTFNTSAGVDFTVKMGDGADAATAYDLNGNILRMQQWGLKVTGSSQVDDLAYAYQVNSNKLLKVTDAHSNPQTKLGDFKDGNNGSADDYGYDANGNLLTDQNKAISSITYNHLNLPSLVTWLGGKGNVAFTYDAAGNKLRKVVTDNTSGTAVVTTTDYLSGVVYQNNVLQFIINEEGRMRFKPAQGTVPAGWQFDYFVKDQLGNTRAVLTEEQRVDKYPVASLEPAKQAIEDDYYTIDPTKIVSNISGTPAYTNDNGIGNNPADPGFEIANSQHYYKLNSNTNKTGLGITLKVMAGDKLDIFGKSYWVDPNNGGPPVNVAPAILELLNGLLGTPAQATAGGHTSAGELNGQPGVTAPILGFITNSTRDNPSFPNRPKAFINYIFLDEQFRPAPGSSFSAVSNSAGLKDHYADMQNIAVQKNGYVYIYVSNESPVNVYFDNLQVVHTRGAVLEETHYYPFGLVMKGISSRALREGDPHNKFKYSSKELQSEEFGDGSGLELYDFEARFHDPQIGRFLQMDPLSEKYYGISAYAYVANDPVNLIDPDGKQIIGSDGKPVTYKRNEDGTITWSDNATADIKTIGEAMLMTPSGTESFDNWINLDTEVSLVLTDQQLLDDEGNPAGAYGKTEVLDNDGNVEKNFGAAHGEKYLNKKGQYKKIKVTISTYNDKDDPLNRYKEASKEEMINAVGVHEEVHSRAKQIKLEKMPLASRQPKGGQEGLWHEPPFNQELKTRIEFNILYPNNSMNRDLYINRYVSNTSMSPKEAKKIEKQATENASKYKKYGN